ncbi:protein FAR1-RELATED SEQUENCE 9-like [Hordeum vulgare subsp. vulgare]|uniref:Protein FAR1-RELATED SEQUENCE n=1 Tax=Hordeum vulgare subsp. vulgare TaxID=112509 RepID=A0A8I6WLR0_HORVV|nr:protein FAR1-RELATED SEQUENCE 9-like [Hordeum vulgare subsp. vulgare]
MQAPADNPGEQAPGPVPATSFEQVAMTSPDRAVEPNHPGAGLRSEKEHVGGGALPEGGLRPTGENHQEHASNGIGTAPQGLLAVILDEQTNSADSKMQQHAEEQDRLHVVTQGHEMSSNDTSSGSDSGSSSGSELDTELGKCFYPSFEELENSRPPEVGMRFPTLEDAERFYSTHAMLTGFAVRRGSNYRRMKFDLECNRSGKLKPTQDLKRKRRCNALGSRCQAKVIVKLHNEQWEFIGVKHEHNHPLCPSPSLASFFLNHKYLSSEEKLFLRVLQQSRVNPRKAMNIFRRMRSNFRKASSSNEKDTSNSKCVDQWRKENSDVETALKRFKELELRNLGFSYTMQKDEDNIVRSLFWTDARSKVDYEIFGDFISFDTTYSTNRHNMPFTPIIGMNSHGRIIVFGCALLQDQKAETFKWMFQTFLDVMGGKLPRIVITDQDEGMATAISEVMPQVRHRFCKFSVMRKTQEILGAFMATRGNINAELHGLVDNSLTEKEFEEGWDVLTERYDASENEYLRLMWGTRKNWVPVYFQADFCPFVESAVHCEGTNLLFKDNVLPKDRIEKFIEQYERMQENIVKAEEEDALHSATEPAYFSLLPIEKHAARMYTRQIFLRAQKELYYSTAFNVHEVQGGSAYRLEKVFDYDNPEFNRNSFEVLAEPGTHAFKCQCAKFTRDGILCCHIFRVFTQLGVKEIPARYMLPRWAPKFKEEQLKEYEEKCSKRRENKMRYTMLLGKMAGISKGICTDGAKSGRLMLELDKVQETLPTTAEENPRK